MSVSPGSYGISDLSDDKYRYLDLPPVLTEKGAK
jgi:hypothetical protein